MSTLVTASQRSVVLEKNGYTHMDELGYIIYCYIMFALDLVMQILDYVNLYRTWAKIRKVRNYFSRCFLQDNHQPKALHVYICGLRYTHWSGKPC